MTIRFAFLAALPLFAFATPAAAQSVSGNSYKVTLEFATCVVSSDAADARALMATVPETAEATALLDKLKATPGCTGKPNDQALRGAIAERLYLTTYANAPAAPSGAAAPFTGSGNPALARWDVLRCAASRDPVGADMLIRSELRSAAEKDAIKRFVPVIGACTPAGVQLGLDKEKMRGLVAEGLLQARKAEAAN